MESLDVEAGLDTGGEVDLVKAHAVDVAAFLVLAAGIGANPQRGEGVLAVLDADEFKDDVTHRASICDEHGERAALAEEAGAGGLTRLSRPPKLPRRDAMSLFERGLQVVAMSETSLLGDGVDGEVGVFQKALHLAKA